MRCRKNQSTLTAQERARFVAAVLALKANGTYDQYVRLHVNNMPGAHQGPAFFPWHREMLRRFELDLQGIDSLVTLPYWNWTIDNSATSAIWNSDFMGGSGRASDGKVLDGPFAFDGGNWPLTDTGGFLARRFGLSSSAPTLPTALDLSNALATTPYDVASFNDSSSLAGFRNTMEGWRNGPQLHNRVHVWIGGSMGPSSSPNDPVFFLHHCFIDKCWADWQALHPGESFFLPLNGAAAGHNLNDAMQPWAAQGTVVTPASVINHHTLGYAYDTERICQPLIPKMFIDSITLKVSDDRPTLKLIDDGPTLKLIDDHGTLKVIDDGGGTFKAIDDVKTPALDIGSLIKVAQDVAGPGVTGADVFSRVLSEAPGVAPFILATPHHTMAWAATFPGSLERAVAQLDLQLASFEGAVSELERRSAAGGANEADSAQLEVLRREVSSLREEREALLANLRK